MSKLDSSRSELADLAAYFDARRGPLMERWRDQVAADPSLDAASEWSLRQFNDHFPDVLAVFCDALRAWPDVPLSLTTAENEYATAHARARWIQGYSLRGVVREWGHFNAVVVDQIASFSTAGDDRRVQWCALSLWARIFNDQQSMSAREYHQLEQSEAETRAVELRRVLDALRSGSVVRGRVLETLASTMRNDLQVVATSNVLADERGDWRDTYELKRMSRESFHSLDEALSNMVTLAHLEAGHEARRIERFDAGQGLCLLVDGMQHVAAQQGSALRVDGPEHMAVWGDAARVRRLAKHLLLCALRGPEKGDVRIRWSPSSEPDARWHLVVEHPLHVSGTREGTEAGRALAAASVAVETITRRGPGEEDLELAAGELPVAPGDGVDLLISKHLCELLDGSLEVEAEADLLRYRISLPAAYGERPH